MKRLWWWLLLLGCSWAWGQALEIISLRCRSAEQPTPFVEPGGVPVQ